MQLKKCIQRRVNTFEAAFHQVMMPDSDILGLIWWPTKELDQLKEYNMLMGY